MTFQSGGFVAGREQRDVQFAVFQSPNEPFGCVLKDFKSDFRITLLKFSDQRRQNVRRDGGNGPNGQPTRDFALQLVHTTACIGDLGETFSRVLEQTFAGLGHHDRTREAIEQPFTHLGFQLLNLLTERRLSYMFASSRARETAFVNDSNEVTELMNLHRENLVGDGVVSKRSAARAAKLPPVVGMKSP